MRVAPRFVLCVLLLATTAEAQFARPSATGLLSTDEIAARLRLFAPARLTADTLSLSAGDRKALRDLIAAGTLVERAYLRQNVAGGDTIPSHLASDTSAEGTLRRRYFLINMSPWSSYDMNRSIIPGVQTRRPAQANLYPATMNRSSWGGWFIALDPSRQAEASGPYHVVRDDSAKQFVTVPYSTEYADLLSPAADRIRRAAGGASDPGLKKYLSALASSFSSNDYRAAEAAGMRTDGPVSVTMGPSSLYLDGLFRYKRSFEAVIGVRNEPASRRLREMEKLLPEIAKELGVTGPPPVAGKPAARTVRIDDAAFVGAGARSGSIASTLKLPVDTTLIPETGTRTIILRNVHEAKFSSIQAPIARAMLDPAQAALVGFEAYFLHLAMRELCSRFEPADPWKSGAATGADIPADPAPVLAGAKADAAALIALDLMARRGAPGPQSTDRFYVTQVAGLLTSLRFWGDDPASAAAAIEFNFHREQGALKYDPAGGLIRIDIGKLKASVRKLHSTIGALQNRGDVNEAGGFLSRYAVQPPELRGLREQLSTFPVDIEPSFPLAD